jgi:lipopolysaccharide biosynthesis glycosyltransferase
MKSELSTDDSCNVVFCFDEKFLVHAFQAVWGVLHHFGTASSPRSLTIYVFFEGAHCPGLDELSTFVADGAADAGIDASLVVEHVDMDSRVVSSTTGRAYPSIVYARFACGTILPPSCRRAIYLDVDITVVADVGELHEMDMNGAPIGAVVDTCGNETYFNSGVLLMDLGQFRSRYEGELFDMQKNMPSAKYPDQDVLNKVFHGKWYGLDPSWNFRSYWRWVFPDEVHCSHDFCPFGLYGGWSRPARIIHFACPEKPWQAEEPHSIDADVYRTSLQVVRARSPYVATRISTSSVQEGPVDTRGFAHDAFIELVASGTHLCKDMEKVKVAIVHAFSDQEALENRVAEWAKVRDAQRAWYSARRRLSPFPEYVGQHAIDSRLCMDVFPLLEQWMGPMGQPLSDLCRQVCVWVTDETEFAEALRLIAEDDELHART